MGMYIRALLLLCVLYALPSLAFAQLGPGGMCYEIQKKQSTCALADCAYCVTALGSVGKGTKGVGATYVNTYTQKDDEHGTCTGCSFAPQTGTAREYDEQVPAYSVSNYPNSPEWQYLARQLHKAKQGGAQVIDLDNVDAYSRDVVIKMYDLAGSAGLRVLAKNVFDPALLQHGAVAGGLYEPDGDAAAHVQKIAQAVGAMGNKNFPVFVIEHNKQAADAAALAMTKAGLNGGATWSGGKEYTRTGSVVTVGSGGVYTTSGKFASVENPDQFFSGLGNASITGGVLGGNGSLGGLFSSIAGASSGNGGILSGILRSVGLGGSSGPGSGSNTASGAPKQNTSIPVLQTLLGLSPQSTSGTGSLLGGSTAATANLTCTTERIVWQCTGGNTARVTTDDNKTISTYNEVSGDVFVALSPSQTLTLKCLADTKVLATDTCTPTQAPTTQTPTDPQYSYQGDSRVIRKKERACGL